MVGFVLAGAGVAATGWLAVAALRLELAAEAVAAWWVLVCAEVVASLELLFPEAQTRSGDRPVVRL